ncbi:hypothetical protein [Thermosulfuriphilus sp.]
MPYFIRAKTYFGYAKKELDRAREYLAAARYQEAFSYALAAATSALKALYAVNFPQAPNGPLKEEDLLEALDLWQDSVLSADFKDLFRRLKDLLSQEKTEKCARQALELATKAVSLAQKALGPLLPQRSWRSNQ